MKLTITLTFMSLIAIINPVAAIEFFHGSWEEALLKAREEKKIIFVDAYTSWCGPCKLMSSKVFPQEQVSEFYNEKFINVKLDMEKGEGPAFAKKYGIRAYPTLLYIDDKGKLLQRKVGVMQANELISTGKAILKKFNRKEDYDKIYSESKNHSATFIVDYLKELRKADASTSKVANLFLRSNQTVASDTLAFIGFEGVETVDSKLFEIIRENKTFLIQTYGEDHFQKRIIEACDETISLAKEFDSPELVDDISKVEDIIGRDILPLYKIKYELLDKNWMEASSKSLQVDKSDSRLQLDVLTSLDPFVEDHKVLNPAIGYLADRLVRNIDNEDDMLQVFKIAKKTNDQKLLEELKKSAKKKLSKMGVKAEDFYSNI